MSAPEGKLEAKIAALRILEEIIERLRGPCGCPWDREQTLLSMASNLLEETCEAIDAIQAGQGSPTPAVLEELGDILMNILLTARIAEEAGAFGIQEVAESISAKLVRRHPHVFGGEQAATAEEVLKRWNVIKDGEKAGGSGSRIGRVPRSMPALAAAWKVGAQAGSVGFDWPDAASVLQKVEEEVREVAQALGGSAGSGSSAAGPTRELHCEIGDLLFAVASLARKAGVDPESALRSALERFAQRFRFIEERTDVNRASLEEMEAIWREAKSHDS